MTSPAPKRDNSHLSAKVALRARWVAGRPGLRVLDAYAGQGVVWDTVETEVGVTVQTLKVDRRGGTGVLKADNRRALISLDLSRFDAVDLDAYGVPAEQLAAVAERSDAPCFVTVIFRADTQLPHALLSRVGIPTGWARHPAILRSLPVIDVWDGFCHAVGYRHRVGYTIREGSMVKRYDLLTK